MSNFWDKYLLILTTTKEILVHPFEFGERLEDSPRETKRAATYLGEGVIFFYSLYQLSTFGADTQLPFADLPFSSELLAGAMILSALLTGLITHPVALWFSDSKTSIHGSLASFLYWSGFCLFVIPPLFAAFILISDWLFAALNFTEDMKLFSFMAIGVPFVFIYYVGTISNWIGSAYRMEPIMGGISVGLAYAISVGTASALFTITAPLFRSMA